MTGYVALLRAVNVGGTGKLPMSDLTAMCIDEGFAEVKTYIASGNVAFATDRSEAAVKAALESRLAEYFGKACQVFVRTADEIELVLSANPFPAHSAKHTYAMFLDEAPTADAISNVKGRTTEGIELGRREIYVAYPDGMGRSRLRLPIAERATARNLSTVAKLAELAAARAGSGHDGARQ